MLFKKYWEKSYRIRVVELGDQCYGQYWEKTYGQQKGAWNFRPVVQPYRDNRTKRMEISTIIYITESKAKQIQYYSSVAFV